MIEYGVFSKRCNLADFNYELMQFVVICLTIFGYIANLRRSLFECVEARSLITEERYVERLSGKLFLIMNSVIWKQY